MTASCTDLPACYNLCRVHSFDFPGMWYAVLGSGNAPSPASSQCDCAIAHVLSADLTWGLASSAPTSSTQSACEMQMRDQGVTAASASRMMNLQPPHIQSAPKSYVLF